MGLSRRAYAALRGVQMRAVRKAIATGGSRSKRDLEAVLRGQHQKPR